MRKVTTRIKYPRFNICKRCEHGLELHGGAGCMLCPTCRTKAPAEVRTLDLNSIVIKYRNEDVMPFESEDEWCIHGMYPPEKCTICIAPKTESGFKFEPKVVEDDS